jgi:hypothetical protein
MVNEDKNNIEWKPLQAVLRGISLNEIIKEEFIEAFKEAFKEDNISAIEFDMFIGVPPNESASKGNSADDKNPKMDIISLSHKTATDTKDRILVVDMNFSDSYKKVQNAIDIYKRGLNES